MGNNFIFRRFALKQILVFKCSIGFRLDLLDFHLLFGYLYTFLLLYEMFLIIFKGISYIYFFDMRLIVFVFCQNLSVVVTAFVSIFDLVHEFTLLLELFVFILWFLFTLLQSPHFLPQIFNIFVFART